MPPAVQNHLITVLPGETVLVEATISDHGPTEYARVDKVIHPERTLYFRLEQHRSPEATFMQLTSKPPFDRDIRLHLRMMLLANDRIVQTSSCPIPAGLQSFESWPDAIFQILVDDIEFIDKADDHACNS